jgi:hypothetical protein
MRLGGPRTGAENLALTGIRSPDRPARSQSLYRLRYPAHSTGQRDRIICHTLWPARSPDLRPCGYLWRRLKGKACKNNPHTEDGLKSQARST